MVFSGLLGIIEVTDLFWDTVVGGSLLSQTQPELSYTVTPENRYLLLSELLSKVQ